MGKKHPANVHSFDEIRTTGPDSATRDNIHRNAIERYGIKSGRVIETYR
jgi:hypothetical protein